jgi:tRNA-specific 2-thiouridylase
MAKIRYNAPKVPAVIRITDSNRVRVDFEEPQRAITPGQAVVFYQMRLYSGATIKS